MAKVSRTPNIQDLVNKEIAKEQASAPASLAPSDNTVPASTAEEKDVVQQQLNDFMNTPAPTPPAAPTSSTLPPFNPTDAEEPETPAAPTTPQIPQQSQPQIGFPQAPAPTSAPSDTPRPPQTPAA